MKNEIKIMMSNHHIHLSGELSDILFGKDYKLTRQREIGDGEFVSAETVTIKGPSGILENVRVVGPLRPLTQAELLASDCCRLGVNAPLRNSWNLDGAAALLLIGPNGQKEISCGIVAEKHIHLSKALSSRLGIREQQRINIQTCNGLVFEHVLVRVHSGKSSFMHLNKDEGLAAGLQNGDMAQIIL
ncbi:PduL/EutD family phosphate acyltransferase [Clostridium transplantifaecale]|uniref:PduL/EutD family phosphate acyltransferase n=1 Tax=Clostridium transplantifaecale TaxID=2479838 RepID=UPI000F62D4FA|nr:PduL/EutD family phosphate acyltransferase [Clostridium transplantifaecale]